MNDKKLLVLVTEKCKASGLELDEAVNNITALMEQKGLDEKTAVIGWMAANSQTLKRVKMDIDAVILYYDVVGRTVQAKGKNVMAHDLIVLGAYKDAEGEVTKVLKGTLWLGDKENGLIDEVAKLQLNSTVYTFKNVGLETKTNKLAWTKDTTFVDSKKDVKALMKKAKAVYACDAINFLDEVMLYRGNVARGALANTADTPSFGLELGYIADNPTELVEPVMVWFPQTADAPVSQDDIDALVGKEVLYAARYYLAKKDETIKASGYSVMTE